MKIYIHKLHLYDQHMSDQIWYFAVSFSLYLNTNKKGNNMCKWKCQLFNHMRKKEKKTA